MNRYIIGVCIFLVSLTGCGDFLEEQSQDLAYAVNCRDLQELLVGGAFATRKIGVKDVEYMGCLHVMDDDTEEAVYGVYGANLRERLGGFHIWMKDPCYDSDKKNQYDDVDWPLLYTHLGVCNAVLNKVEEFTGEKEEDRNHVKGQAYFLRAMYYFYLVNMYGKPYSDATSSNDLGVPLKTFSYIDDRHWTRTTVDSVYHQIVSDLNNSIHCFSGMTPKSFFWIGEDAARVLLSRVYCYMGKWELVPALCNAVLKKPYKLYDLKTRKPADRCLVYKGSPEIIFTMGGNSRDMFNVNSGSTISSFGISPELANLYAAGDLRPSVLFQTHYSGATFPIYASSYIDNTISDMFMIRLPEVYLNLAEALAMTGDEPGAKNALRELRRARIKAANFEEEIAESGERLVNFIRDERRREFAFEGGHRWFDLRRYAVSPKYPFTKEIRHKTYEHATGSISTRGTLKGEHVLAAYPDGGWTLPIPGFEIKESDGAMVNNEREDSIFY